MLFFFFKESRPVEYRGKPVANTKNPQQNSSHGFRCSGLPLSWGAPAPETLERLSAAEEEREEDVQAGSWLDKVG